MSSSTATLSLRQEETPALGGNTILAFRFGSGATFGRRRAAGTLLQRNSRQSFLRPVGVERHHGFLRRTANLFQHGQVLQWGKITSRSVVEGERSKRREFPKRHDVGDLRSGEVERLKRLEVLERRDACDLRVGEVELLKRSEVVERRDIGDLRVGEAEYLKRGQRAKRRDVRRAECRPG